MDQDEVSHSKVPGVINPPTSRYSWEPEPEKPELVSDFSEKEPLPRLKKWALAGNLDSSSSTTPRKTPDDKFVEFQAKYATWNREYQKMWKHVREMKRIGRDVAAGVTASYIAVKSRELHEMRRASGLEDAADLARKIYQVSGLENSLFNAPGHASYVTAPRLSAMMPWFFSYNLPNAQAFFTSQRPFFLMYLQMSVDILTHPLTTAMLIQTLAQQKAERSRTSPLQYNDNWARPGLVNLILMSLPYRTERTTVVAALREFRGRVSYALDYLMPGKGIADLSDSEPGYDDYLEDPPTPGKGVDVDLREDDPPTPSNGIDFDLPEDDLPMPGDDPNTQQNERLWAYVQDLEKRMDRFQEDLASLKTRSNR